MVDGGYLKVLCENPKNVRNEIKRNANSSSGVRGTLAPLVVHIKSALSGAASQERTEICCVTASRRDQLNALSEHAPHLVDSPSRTTLFLISGDRYARHLA